MTMAVFWWLIAGLFIVIELLSGTFYFLLLSLSFAAGALSSYVGFSVFLQITVIACSCVIVTYVFYRYRWRLSGSRINDKEVSLDIGATITVDAWQQGTAQVQYRGATWQARCVAGQNTHQGTYKIVGVEGNCLLLEECS